MVSAAGPLGSVGTDRENDPLSPQNPYTEKIAQELQYDLLHYHFCIP